MEGRIMADHEALFAAIQSGDVGAVQELVGKDRTVASAKTPEGVSALMMALYFAQDAIVELLAAQRPEVDFFEAAKIFEAEMDAPPSDKLIYLQLTLLLKSFTIKNIYFGPLISTIPSEIYP